MLEEFMGLPAHPLLIHAPVVLVPLLGLVAVAYALVPVVRPHTRWVLGLLAVAAPVSALLAKLSGDAFFARLDEAGRITEGFYPTIEAHRDLGNLTLYTTIPLGILALALVLLVAPRGAAGPTAGSDRSGRVVSLVLQVLVVIAAGVSIYYVIRTGDSGAKAVWSGS